MALKDTVLRGERHVAKDARERGNGFLCGHWRLRLWVNLAGGGLR